VGARAAGSSSVSDLTVTYEEKPASCSAGFEVSASANMAQSAVTSAACAREGVPASMSPSLDDLILPLCAVEGLPYRVESDRRRSDGLIVLALAIAVEPLARPLLYAAS